MRYTSVFPSYCPVNAMVFPSGENRGNISNPASLVRRRAMPPPTGTVVEIAGVREDDLVAVDGREAQQTGLILGRRLTVQGRERRGDDKQGGDQQQDGSCHGSDSVCPILHARARRAAMKHERDHTNAAGDWPAA